MPRFKAIEISDTKLSELPNGPDVAARIPTGGSEWFWFARGYLDAAETLARELEQRPQERSHLAAPMMFLYRHHIELHLKYLLKDLGEVLDDPQTVPNQHYLLTLWKRVKSLIGGVVPPPGQAWVHRVEAIIQDFESHDPASYAWRYPETTKGVASLSAEFAVDPRVVRAVFAELSLILEGASAAVALAKELRNERI